MFNTAFKWSKTFQDIWNLPLPSWVLGGNSCNSHQFVGNSAWVGGVRGLCKTNITGHRASSDWSGCWFDPWLAFVAAHVFGLRGRHPPPSGFHLCGLIGTMLLERWRRKIPWSANPNKPFTSENPVDQWTQSRGTIRRRVRKWWLAIFHHDVRSSKITDVLIFHDIFHAKTTVFLLSTTLDPSASLMMLRGHVHLELWFQKTLQKYVRFPAKEFFQAECWKPLFGQKDLCIVLTLDWIGKKHHQPRLPVLYLNLCQRHQLTLIQWRYHATLDAKWLQCCPNGNRFTTSGRPYDGNERCFCRHLKDHVITKLLSCPLFRKSCTTKPWWAKCGKCTSTFWGKHRLIMADLYGCFRK